MTAISAGGTEGSRGDQSYFGSGTSIHANDSAEGLEEPFESPPLDQLMEEVADCCLKECIPIPGV